MNTITPSDLLIALFYQENDTFKIVSQKDETSELEQHANSDYFKSNTLQNKVLAEILLALENQEDIPIEILESLAITLNFLSNFSELDNTEIIGKPSGN
ncbi:hypothetical protein [Sessilibacter corallicola]|uniref:hypothetical protein n=1 Tax=Sessilibacter corallicola TaxID=2904075 RepID=UPI001E52AEB5|nr:hypothetical protein [Sessilibacter corallicola]MCE2029952.1 hypothetical protein [Sessilibacter corallicola]